MTDNDTKQPTHKDAREPRLGHEVSDFRIGPIVWFLIGLAVATVVIGLLVVGLFDAFESREEKSKAASSPLSNERQKLPPEPRLQLAPSTEEQLERKLPPDIKKDSPLQQMKRLREEENQQLTTYGWVDEKAGVVRIPIEEAKKRLLEKVLPTRKR